MGGIWAGGGFWDLVRSSCSGGACERKYRVVCVAVRNCCCLELSLADSEGGE